MSYFAKVLGREVLNIIVAEPSFFDTYVDTMPGEWVETSLGTYGNVHYGEDGAPDGKPPLRGNYAEIGGVYDPEFDVFYSKQPYPSWALSHETWLWLPPVPKPNDGALYNWDETNQEWVKAPENVDA